MGISPYHHLQLPSSPFTNNNKKSMNTDRSEIKADSNCRVFGRLLNLWFSNLSRPFERDECFQIITHTLLSHHTKKMTQHYT